MKEFGRFGLLVPILLSFGIASVGEATSFQAIPFEETVQDAPVVARGRVSMQYVEWATLSNGAKRLYTYIELQPLTLLKAPADWAGKNRLIVREIGGQKDGVGMSVPGSAKFSIGEEVVVFVSDAAEPDGSYDLRGLMLSKLIVKESEDGQEELLGPAISMGEDARPGQVVHADHDGGAEEVRPTRTRWTVQALQSLIEKQGGSGIQGAVRDQPAATSPISPTNPSSAASDRTVGTDGVEPESQEPVPNSPGTEPSSTPEATIWNTSRRWVVLGLALVVVLAVIRRIKS